MRVGEAAERGRAKTDGFQTLEGAGVRQARAMPPTRANPAISWTQISGSEIGATRALKKSTSETLICQRGGLAAAS